jgi:hypothetical protein
MLALLIDENSGQRILRGLKLRLPQLDYVIVQDIGLRGVNDPELLRRAAEEGRVIVTHDVNTVTKFARDRMQSGLPMPGVVIVPEQMEIGPAINDLEIIIECCVAADLENQIQYIPL